MKKEIIDADALLGYLQGKWDENKRLSEETLQRLGEHVDLHRDRLLLADFALREYRQFVNNIFDECRILDMIHSSNELILMTVHQFGLKIK